MLLAVIGLALVKRILINSTQNARFPWYYPPELRRSAHSSLYTPPKIRVFPRRLSAFLQVILCQMRMSMAAVCGALLYRNVKHVRFDDLMTIPERQAALAAFHDDAPFLVMSTRTKGIGLNLQIATTVRMRFYFNTFSDVRLRMDSPKWRLRV